MKHLHLHLVSDSTGETVSLVGRSCLAQFEDINLHEHVWNMVLHERQLDEIIEGLKINPGIVLFTLVDEALCNRLQQSCKELNLPCIPVLDPVISAMRHYLHSDVQAKPGSRHMLNDAYFSRIEAINFVLGHDDGQAISSLNSADVIVVGVSRTSKTPTCFYLANRGLKAANVPLVPEVPLPKELMAKEKPFVVGLTMDPKPLVEIRKNRVRMLGQMEDTPYTDLDAVTEEIKSAKRLYVKNKWPVINVTRRSIEEIAASILQYYYRQKAQALG